MDEFFAETQRRLEEKGVEGGQLVDMNRSEEGSPKVEIFYNTEIRNGSVMKWRT